MFETITNSIPETLKATTMIRTFGITKVPLIFAVSPKVVQMTKNNCEIKIPLNYRTKNHLGSMYFGALCIGADIAVGMHAFDKVFKRKEKISVVFKDVKGNFLKRPESDAHFFCEDGERIEEMIERALETGERQSVPLKCRVTCPKIDPDVSVAEFVLTLSLKVKS